MDFLKKNIDESNINANAIPNLTLLMIDLQRQNNKQRIFSIPRLPLIHNDDILSQERMTT